MSCECFNNCDYCDKKNDEPCELFDGSSPFCREFVCNVDECKRSFCFKRTEVLDSDCDEDYDDWDDEIYED